MSNSKLSFSIALNLLTDNFKKGTNSVKRGFMSMQAQVLTFAAALGFGGLGLSNFISKMIEVSKATSRAVTALKNVSVGTAQYIESQKYLISLSKKYGLEINALTSNFARFTASASQAGMAMDEQRKIFDAVSRATTAFSLSAGETDGVFLALSQMMSKGKISSEELRLQMGEKLPIALQAMAKAAGVSIAQLDEMMRKGELISSEMLPKFAQALTEMTPSIDTDNLETSLNKLSNAFTDLTAKAGIEQKYKGLIDRVTALVEVGANNLKNILVGVVAVIAFVIANSLTKLIRGWNITANSIVANTKTANATLIAAEAKKDATLRALEEARLQHSIAVGNKKVKIAEKIGKLEVLNAKAVVAHKRAEINAEKVAAAAKMSIRTRTGNALKIGIAKLATSLKAMWNTFAPALIVSAIVAIVGYFKNLYDETNRIKNIFKDYKKEAETISHTPEIVQLQTLQNLYNKASGDIEEQKKYKKEILNLLGTELKDNQDLNDLIAERIKLLETTARVDFYTRKKIEAEDKANSIKRELKEKKEAIEKSRVNGARDVTSVMQDTRYGTQMSASELADDRAKSKLAELKPLEDELAELTKVIKDANDNISEGTSTLVTNSTDPNTPPPGTKKEESELDKQKNRYTQKLRELSIQLEHGLLSQVEYNKAKDEATKSAFIEAKSSTDKEVLNSQYLQMLEEAINHPLYNSTQVEIESHQTSYAVEVKKLLNQKANNRITEEEYRKKVLDLTNSTLDTLATFDAIDKAGEAFVLALENQAVSLASTPDLKSRDTFFDYKKSNKDILSEELSMAKDNYETLKAHARDNIKAFESELNDMVLNIESLEEALKVAEVLEDVKKLKSELNDSIYSGVKDIASGADRMVSAWSRLSEVMSDVDTSGWEKIMALWSTLTNTIDSLLSIVKLIEQFSELTQQLSAAKEAEAMVDTATTQTKITNAVTETAVRGTLTATETEIEKQASQQKTAAATKEMAAKTGAAYAKFPFVGIALAAAAVAGFMALIPKFATGGIIKGGPTSGDKVLARVNAGEMILNQAQQGNLFKAINSGQLGGANGSQHINIGVDRVRGADLFLSLKNYMKSSGKRF